MGLITWNRTIGFPMFGAITHGTAGGREQQQQKQRRRQRQQQQQQQQAATLSQTALLLREWISETIGAF